MADPATLSPTIEFIDLGAQRRHLGDRIEQAVLRVVRHGKYILGPEVAELERRLSAFCGARHALTCSSGTDALALCLMAKGVQAGDAVLCPAFTFAATAEVVAWLGAVPVFVDILEDTFNIDPDSLETGIHTARRLGLRPTAVISVDLFGQPADYDRIEPIVRDHGLWLLSDAAQSFGATYNSRAIGTIGAFTATSFFPAKPLGCYGDGGAVFTDDDAAIEVLHSLRVHGQGTSKYDNVRIGMNGRMDTLQAAVLIEKLAIFQDEIAMRQVVADRYTDGLADLAEVPRVLPGCRSVWAQYTVRLPGLDRDAVARRLSERSIPTAIYYPKPLHRQPAYWAYPVVDGGLPVSDKVGREVLSLPMHPYLEESVQGRIIDTIRDVIRT